VNGPALLEPGESLHFPGSPFCGRWATGGLFGAPTRRYRKITPVAYTVGGTLRGIVGLRSVTYFNAEIQENESRRK
jgi:hypothetical protein